jgi:hypothetical protein
MPEAAKLSSLTARRRTVNEPAALKVAFTGEPLAGAAPPSKFQLNASPFPLPEKLALSPALKLLGAAVMLPFGRVMGTLATWEVFRPSTHDEKGKKLAWEIGDPFNVTASEPSSKVQVALNTTLIDPLVTSDP